MFFVKRNVDLIIGGYSTLNQNDKFISSFPYMNDDLTWCVQKAKLLPQYMIVMKVYNTSLWIIVFSLAFSISVIFYLLLSIPKNEKLIDYNQTFFTVMLPLFVNLTAYYEPKSIPMRMIYISISFSGLIFFSYTFAQLQFIIFNEYSYRNDQIDKFNDLQTNKFTLIGNQFAIQRYQVRKYQTENNLFIK